MTHPLAGFAQKVREIFTRPDDLARMDKQEQEAFVREALGEAERLAGRGSYTEAVAAYDQLASRAEKQKGTWWRDIAAEALANKGALQSRPGHYEEALASYDLFLKRYGNLPLTPRLGAFLANVLYMKATLLGMAGRRAEEMACYEALYARCATLEAPEVCQMVAEGQLAYGNLLDGEGDCKRAIAVFRRVVDRYGKREETALRDLVAQAWGEIGMALARQDDPQGALEAYDNALAEQEKYNLPLTATYARILLAKGMALTEFKGGAIEAYDRLYALFSGSSDPRCREFLAKGLLNKAVILLSQGKLGDAMAVCDDILVRFGDSPEPALQQQVATALLCKAIALEERGTPREAMAVFDELQARFGKSEDPTLKGLLADAQRRKRALKP